MFQPEIHSSKYFHILRMHTECILDATQGETSSSIVELSTCGGGYYSAKFKLILKHEKIHTQKEVLGQKKGTAGDPQSCRTKHDGHDQSLDPTKAARFRRDQRRAEAHAILRRLVFIVHQKAVRPAGARILARRVAAVARGRGSHPHGGKYVRSRYGRQIGKWSDPPAFVYRRARPRRATPMQGAYEKRSTERVRLFLLFLLPERTKAHLRLRLREVREVAFARLERRRA